MSKTIQRGHLSWNMVLTIFSGVLLFRGNAMVLAQDAAPPVTAPITTRISLDEAISRAQAASPTLVAAQARVEAANARLRAAGAHVAPQLAVAHAFGSNTGGFDEDIILSQSIELGKRGSRVRSARALGSAATFDRAGVGTDLRFNVESAYFEALRAQSELELAGSALATAQAFDEAAKNQLQAGDAPRANVVRSGIEVERARQALADAQTERDNRYATLASLIDQPQRAALELSDSLKFTPLSYDEAALQELALQQRADLAGARALLQSRAADVAVARSAGRPDAFVEARRAAIVPYSGTPNGQSVRLGFNVPLGDFGARRAAVNEARAAQNESEANLQEAIRVARLEVSTSLASLQNAARGVKSFQNGRLDHSKELLDMAQVGYEHGANSYLELIDAQNVYRTEQASYASALANWNTARAALERAVGGHLR